MHGMLLLWGLNVVLNTTGESLWPQYGCCLLISTSLPPDTVINTMTSHHNVALFVMSPWVTSFLHMCYVQQGSFVSSCWYASHIRQSEINCWVQMRLTVFRLQCLFITSRWGNWVSRTTLPPGTIKGNTFSSGNCLENDAVWRVFLLSLSQCHTPLPNTLCPSFNLWVEGLIRIQIGRLVQ